MCGIFGVNAKYSVIGPILEGLTKLEYRGYDSSGIAVIDENKEIKTIRSKGKLFNLKRKIDKSRRIVIILKKISVLLNLLLDVFLMFVKTI